MPWRSASRCDGTAAGPAPADWARDGLTRLDGSSPFAIASITKTFTATIVLQLVDEGRLGCSAASTDLLPGVPVPGGVKVRAPAAPHLGHRRPAGADARRLNADLERVWQPAEVLGAVPGPWFAPGLAWAYSNTNYVLLGMIVERVTGQPFATLLHQRLLDPLELAGTGVLLSEGAPYLMAPSWASAFGTSGDMYASAARPAALGRRAVRRPRPARQGHGPDARLQATTATGWAPSVSVGDPTGYGHSGLLRGFTTLLVHLPDEDLTLALLGTTMFDPATVLTYRAPGKPSILDLAERAAEAEAAA